MGYTNSYGAYTTPAFGRVIPIHRRPISGPFIMGYAAAPAGLIGGEPKERSSSYFGAPAGLIAVVRDRNAAPSQHAGRASEYWGAPAGIADAATRGKLRLVSSAGMGYFGAPAGLVTNPAAGGTGGYTGPGVSGGDIDPSTGHPWGEINPSTGQYWPPLDGGGGGSTPVNYAGIAQLITALGTVGLAGVNTVLTQMNHDQLVQAQRDAQALAASSNAAQQRQAATLNAAIMQALTASRTQTGPGPQQGMSTTTMVVIGGVALAALYFFMQQGKRRRNPVIGSNRSRRYVSPHGRK